MQRKPSQGARVLGCLTAGLLFFLLTCGAVAIGILVVIGALRIGGVI